MSTRLAMPETQAWSPGEEEIVGRTGVPVRTAGVWLAAASLLMIAVFALHGPLAPDLGAQMAKITAAPVKWRVAHWLAAASLSSYAMTGLIVLTARSRLTSSPAALTAWAVVSIGALWTLTTALAEATAVTAAATAGRREAFELWWSFAEGKATGFAFVALGIMVIAWREGRSGGRVTPRWSAYLGAVAGLASFAGWAIGMWVGLRLGSLLWVIASMAMSAWTLWFGFGLVRGRGSNER